MRELLLCKQGGLTICSYFCVKVGGHDTSTEAMCGGHTSFVWMQDLGGPITGLLLRNFKFSHHNSETTLGTCQYFENVT